MRRITAGVGLALSLLSSSTVLAQGWDAAPLRSPTPMPRDGLPAERVQFLTWLERQGGALTPEQGQAAQERLYAYISELAKRRQGAFPEAGDAEAARIFGLAAAFGNVGASHVARRLSTDTTRMPPRAPVPGTRLTLAPPTFAFATTDARFGICFPYYFMSAPSGRQTLANGVATDVLVLSTLFAADRGPAGASQATILVLAAAPRDSAKHVALWQGQLGVAPVPSPAEDPKGEWYAAPASEEMRRLAVVRRLPTAVVVVAYVGLGGTFETNRPHFFDVLRTLGTSRCSA